jgi:hypothetical protein
MLAMVIEKIAGILPIAAVDPPSSNVVLGPVTGIDLKRRDGEADRNGNHDGGDQPEAGSNIVPNREEPIPHRLMNAP